jgi:hypothetical protein
MKIVNYLMCCLLLVACKSTHKQPATDSLALTDSIIVSADTAVDAPQRENVNTIFKPYKLTGDFIVTDTGEYDFGIGTGVYAIVKKQNILIDTIDSDYGLNKVDSNKYLYIKVTHAHKFADEQSDHSAKSIWATNGDYILLDNNKKYLLNSVAQGFGWFANPIILRNKIYYWKIKDGNKTYHISAAVFNPLTKTTKSYYLFDHPIESDNEGFFEMALESGDAIIFRHEGKSWKFSPDFKKMN